MGLKMKHNLTEEYLQSLTEEERIRQMSEWTPSEWQQYLCPNGTITLEEFRTALYNKVDEVMTKKYGNEYMTPEEARSKLHEFVNKLERKYGKR